MSCASTIEPAWVSFKIRAVTTLGPSLSQAFPVVGQDIVFASMNVLLGTVVILFLLFEPKGLMHRVGIAKQAFRRWPFRY